MKRTILNSLLSAFAVVALAWLNPAFAQPANDLCSNAIPVTCGVTVSGTTTNATTDAPGGITFCGTSINTPGVWYSITGDDSMITVTTCNAANYDTKISVFDGTCQFVSCVGGNDDDFGGGCGLTSTVTFQSTMGVPYLILVHGFGGQTGDFDLTVTCTAPPPPTNNDACVDAIPITCGTNIMGSTTGQTFDGVGFCGTSNSAAGVWYEIDGTGSAITLSTCNQASYDTKISVFTGTCGALSCVGGQDDAAGCAGFTTEFTFFSTIGETYLILVHGFGTATGNFTLSATCAGPPTGNDICSGALPIACNSSVSGSTSSATFDGVGFCGTSNTAPGVWYSFTRPTSGPVELTTCSPFSNYDTKLSVFEGSCAGLVCVDGNDDDFSCPNSIFHSNVTFNATGGTTYFVLVHGFGSASGDFELTLSCPDPPSNDLPCDAIPLFVGANPYPNLLLATADPGEVSPGSGTGFSTCNSTDGWCSFETDVDNSIWYTFTSPEAGNFLDIQLDNTQDLQFAVYEVGDCSDYSTFVEIAGNDDSGPGLSPRITLNGTEDLSGTSWPCLMPGITYYLQVDGFAGTGGAGNIIVTDEFDFEGACQDFNPVVPTMGEWGLIILGLILLCIGTIYVRRRQSILGGVTQN